jgi:O-antigen ligase
VRARKVAEAADETGPIGPVALLALLFLLAASPLMRGGNRHVALIVLEGAALVFLVAALTRGSQARTKRSISAVLVGLLLSSPLWLAAIYLLPVPASWWAGTPGRNIYPELLAGAGIATSGSLPLSLVPDATEASLLAGIPMVAAFAAGYWMRLRQLKLALTLFVALAMLEVVMGLLQIAGGADSALYFNVKGGRAVGTFANPNHFANYVAMALAVYFWLASNSVSLAAEQPPGSAGRFSRPLAIGLWSAGGLLLLVGILISRSRGAALSGLPAAVLAFLVVVTATSQSRQWRKPLLLAALGLGAAVALVGFDRIVPRFQLNAMAGDASFRTLLAASTMDGVAQFWPWGSGWGTYGWVFPRFQPPTIVGIAEYAHHDYAQLLFEGGVFAVLLMGAFAWLAGSRTVALVREARKRRRLRSEQMLAAVCGIGLLGFLLHSLVEFNMHIPANAVAAALLAGVFLRPSRGEEDPRGD